MFCPPGHKHAETSTCRVTHRCECEPCRVAHNERHKAWTPRTRLPAGPVKARIQAMTAAGARQTDIARAAGVSQSTIALIGQGRYERVSPDVARRIMGVRNVRVGGLVKSWRARRRVEALMCLGWSRSALARRTGLSVRTIEKLLNGAHETVQDATARVIFKVFEELSTCPPVAGGGQERRWIEQTRREALAAGFAPPAAWDDIDAADAVPVGAAA